MNRLLLVLSLFASGCLYQPTPSPGPDDKPAPAPSNVSAVEKAAAQGMADYSSAAADVCKSLRGRSGEFKNWSEFQRAWEKENLAARIKSFDAYSEAVNAELFDKAADGSWKTDVPIDAAELDRVLMEAERGFRGK